jgi:hypothetical protein
MNPTTQKQMDSSNLGRIIGYNTDSGLLYKTQCGMNQFKPKSNVIPTPVYKPLYQNTLNTKQTLDEMNSNKEPDYYEGNKSVLKVPIEIQPKPFVLSGGEVQDKADDVPTGSLKIMDTSMDRAMPE